MELGCCFTGHRMLNEQVKLALKTALDEQIRLLIQQGVEYFYAGGALGFDTLAAISVLELRRFYPEIRLFLVFPCHAQTRGWKERDCILYEQIKEQADGYLYITDAYERGCMFRRNRYLVDHSQYCICYQKKQTGGTAYTVRYAQNKGLEIINLADKLFFKDGEISNCDANGNMK